MRRSLPFLLAPLFASAVGCTFVLDTDPFVVGVVSANAGADVVVSLGATANLDASASTQSSGKRLTFRWEQTAGPTVAFSPDEPTISISAPQEQTRLEFTVHVSDGRSEVSDSVVVDVDSTPVADAGADTEVMSIRTAYLDGSRSHDPDDEALSFHWTQTSGTQVTLDGAETPVASFQTTRDRGSYDFDLEVCDDQGTCAHDAVTVRVERWTKLIAAGEIAAAIRSDGTVWTWGGSFGGSLGVEVLGSEPSAAPVRVPGLSDVTNAWIGRTSIAARTSQGATYAWGTNYVGESGSAAGASYAQRAPKLVDAAREGFTELGRGSGFALYIAPGGALTGVGYNYYGLRGTCPGGGVAPAPSAIAGTFTRALVSSADTMSSDGFAGAITSTRELYTWGINTYGQLGHGPMSPTSGYTCVTPGAVLNTLGQPVSDVYDAAFGYAHAAAITSTFGYLSVWGMNQNNGTGHVGVPAVHGFGYRSVAASSNHSLALKTDGSMYAWGENTYGQLGLGHKNASWFPSSNEPARVGTDSDWVSIAAGAYNAYAMKADGTIWSWGYNGDALGSGYKLATDATTPQRIVDGPARCGDGVVSSGRGQGSLWYTEACDDGPLNGSPGRCSASCRCPSTRVVYVDAAATGNGDGTSWANARTSVQASIDAASPCDTIWVAGATYTASSSTASTPVLAMAATTEIYGGFAGYETHFAQRDASRNVTVLDGEGTHHHVVVGADGGVLDGFTIRGGNATGAMPDDSGGGFFLTAAGMGRVTLRHLRFESNAAVDRGGAVFATHASDDRQIFIDDVVFADNRAASGGAVAIVRPHPYITNSSFYSNRATSSASSGRVGGALRLEGFNGSLPGYISNALFVANSADDAGAAMWTTGNHYVSFSTFYGNTTAASTIHVEGASTTMQHCAMWNPGIAATSLGGGGSFSSYNSAYAGASTSYGSFSLSADPFAPEGAGATLRPYLATGSPCIDAGDLNAAAGNLRTWFERSSVTDGALDTGKPDLGYHWER